MWSDASYTMGPMNTMLVIAVKKNQTSRRIWEDGFAAELARRGVTPTPSYRLFPSEVPDTSQVIAAVKANNYDGVLTVSRLASEMNTTYVPGYVETKPVYGYNELQKKYYTYYEREYHPGFTDSTKIVRHEANVWTTREGGRMIWSGTGEVLDPASSKAVNDEIVNLIIPELEKDGIVPAVKK